MKEGSLNKIIRDILRKTLEEDTASHAVYPAEQGRRIRGAMDYGLWTMDHGAWTKDPWTVDQGL